MSQLSAATTTSSSPGWIERSLHFVADHRSWFIALVAIFVFTVSFLVNLRTVHSTTFHPDESRWINRAHYLSDLESPLGDDWSDRYLLRGQPPFGSYITALGLILQGNDTATNEPFDFHYGNENSITWEAGRNAIPSQEDLIAARQTNAAIGALTAALLTVILAKITNLAGGLVGGIIFAVNGLQEYLSSTALSDATLGLILVLATLATMRLVVKPSWFWTILLGVIFGAGMSAKLSPIALAIGFAAIGVLFLLRRFLVRIPGVRRPINYLAHDQEARTDRLGWMFISLPFIAFAVFVLSYPYVWSEPIGRTQLLFDFRTREMKSQARIWPDLKIKDRGDALGTLWHTFQNNYPSSEKLFIWLSDNTPFPAGVPSIDIFLMVLGLVLAIVTVIRTGFATRLAAAFILLGGQATAIIVGLRVDFNRYYLPILLFGAFCIGYLFGEVFRVIGERYLAKQSRKQASHRNASAVAGMSITPETSDSRP